VTDDYLLLRLQFVGSNTMVERPSPYRAVKTLRLDYKNQSVNAV
jgi:hypothetical protein